MKRFRNVYAKSNELVARYGKNEGELDLFYAWPENETGMSADSKCLMFAIEKVKILDGKTLKELLIERGYDITTLKFSIKKLNNILENNK